MSLVDEKDGEEAFFREFLDVVTHGEEHVAGGVAARDGEGAAKMAVEVAATESDVVAVGHADGLGGHGVTEGTQDAGLADARLAGDDGVFFLVDAFDELIDEGA